MGFVTIEFMGICVNFSQTHHPGLPVTHRIVLPRVDITHLPPIPAVDGKRLPPHFATLSYPTPMGPAVMPLTGCILSVVNPLNFGHINADMNGIPNLTNLEQSIGESLGPPSTPVLYGKNSLVTACWFDFDTGTIEKIEDPVTHEVRTRARVETDGDPRLRYVPFPSALYPPPAQMEFTPTTGETVIVQNSAMPGDEINSCFHFYLSYLTAANLPARLRLVDSCLEDMGGPGCSNSTYP